MYAFQKAQILTFRKGPQITVNTELNYFDETDVFDFKDEKLRIAFSVQQTDVTPPVNMINPEFVRWVARIVTVTSGEVVETLLKFHTCTDEDYAAFFPPESGMKKAVE